MEHITLKNHNPEFNTLVIQLLTMIKNVTRIKIFDYIVSSKEGIDLEATRVINDNNF